MAKDKTKQKLTPLGRHIVGLLFSHTSKENDKLVVENVHVMYSNKELKAEIKKLKAAHKRPKKKYVYIASTRVFASRKGAERFQADNPHKHKAVVRHKLNE